MLPLQKTAIAKCVRETDEKFLVSDEDLDSQAGIECEEESQGEAKKHQKTWRSVLLIYVFTINPIGVL